VRIVTLCPAGSTQPVAASGVLGFGAAATQIVCRVLLTNVTRRVLEPAAPEGGGAGAAGACADAAARAVTVVMPLPGPAHAVTASTVISAAAIAAGRQRLTHLPILMGVLPHVSAFTSETPGAAPDNRNRFGNFRYLARRRGVS
jgi:hypothetical protein